MLLKLAFLLSVPIYSVLAWLVCDQPAAGATDLPVALLFKVLAGVYALAALVVEPMITRTRPYNQSMMLVKMAIYESGALFGLVLTFLSHDFHYFMAFAVPAMVLIALTPVGSPTR